MLGLQVVRGEVLLSAWSLASLCSELGSRGVEQGLDGHEGFGDEVMETLLWMMGSVFCWL